MVRKIVFAAEGLTSAAMMRALSRAEGMEETEEDTLQPSPLEGSLLPETYHYLLGGAAH